MPEHTPALAAEARGDELRQQAAFWKIDISEVDLGLLDSHCFGDDGVTRVNLYAWDLVRRGNGFDWNWVLDWVRQGHPEPPCWLELAAIRALLAHTPGGEAGGATAKLDPAKAIAEIRNIVADFVGDDDACTAVAQICDEALAARDGGAPRRERAHDCEIAGCAEAEFAGAHEFLSAPAAGTADDGARLHAAATELRAFIENEGTWHESAIIDHGSSWHLTLDEYHRFEALGDAVEAALAARPAAAGTPLADASCPDCGGADVTTVRSYSATTGQLSDIPMHVCPRRYTVAPEPGPQGQTILVSITTPAAR